MWFLLAATAALFFAAQSTAAKRAGAHQHPDVVALVGFALPIPLYAALLAAQGLPLLRPELVGWTALSVAGNLVAMPLFFRALATGELSVVLPLASLTPLFALGTERLLLGVTPRLQSGLGVGLLVLGAYLLHAGELRHGPLGPLLALGRSRGARLAVVAALLWSVTAVADRGGVLASSPALYLLAFNCGFSLLLLPWVAWRRRDVLRSLAARPWPVALVGLFGAAMALAQMAALTLAPAAVVVAVKRLAAILGVLLGGALFEERGLRVRLLAAGCMAAGAVALALA